MSVRAGYGRGYYGSAQLAPRVGNRPRSRRGWIAVAAVAGLGGAVIWYMWPRDKSKDAGEPNPSPPDPSPPPPPPPDEGQLPQVGDTVRVRPGKEHHFAHRDTTMTIAEARGDVYAVRTPDGSIHRWYVADELEPADLDQLARLRGFSSTQMFEDSVVGTARALEASGAKVSLGPHLAHLKTRLEP